MLLDHNNIAIFSLPRTGTKLLANIFENFEYHNHGEWFSVLSTHIENNKVIRLKDSLPEINSMSEKQFTYLPQIIDRYHLYKTYNKNVITIWPEYLAEFPFMLEEFKDYHWISIRRNSWDQLLSFYISSKNFNFDGIKTSVPVIFKEDAFRKIYWNYHTVSVIQDWLIKHKGATLIKFDDLISGNSKIFGKNYSVKSKDEHFELDSLVINLDQVKKWFAELEDKKYFKNQKVFS